MFGGNCTITMCNPQVSGEIVKGETYTNNGGEVGYAFLYLPSKQCAVRIMIEDCCGTTDKISAADFLSQLNALGIQLSSGRAVSVEKGLAEVIANESKDEGNFTGLDEIQNRYKDVKDKFWFAKQKVKERYFQVMCEK